MATITVPIGMLRDASPVAEGLRRMYCKAIMNIYRNTGGQPFTYESAIRILLRTTRVTKDHGGQKITTNLTTEESVIIFKDLLRRQWIHESHRKMPDRNKPNQGIPPQGILYYKVDTMRITECSETSWYKSMMRKRKMVAQERDIDEQRCRVLRNIYSIYGNNPFTYDMVTKLPHYLRRLMASRDANLTQNEVETLRIMATTYEMKGEKFQNVWNSLIRNGYIVQHKEKVPGTNKKVATNKYLVNRNYLRKCTGFE